MTDPLEGTTLEAIVTELVEKYGFDELGKRVPLRCFTDRPSIPSALAFLRDTPSAREKVECFYLFHLREQKRRAARTRAEDLRATAELVLEATSGVTSVVEDVQKAIGAVPVVTDLVYRAVRGITGVVGNGIDAALVILAPLFGAGEPNAQREALVAALNGVVGDHLEATGNPLAIRMALRPPLAGLHRGGTLLVLVHGSCLNDLQWTRRGHDHGLAMAHDLGFTQVYVHYNTGRHVSENGTGLAALLEAETAPFEQIAIVGHSMGGLVARAALRAAEEAHHAWRRKVRVLVTLGTPHHGAPLERGGNALEWTLGKTKYSAPLRALGEIRSAGVTDLRYGNVVEADWRGRGRFERLPDLRTPTPLPKDVSCYAVAGTSGLAPSKSGALPSDGIVPVKSALGEHPNEAFALRFTKTRIVYGTGHLDLLSSPEVFALLREWLEDGCRKGPPA